MPNDQPYSERIEASGKVENKVIFWYDSAWVKLRFDSPGHGNKNYANEYHKGAYRWIIKSGTRMM